MLKTQFLTEDEFKAEVGEEMLFDLEAEVNFNQAVYDELCSVFLATANNMLRIYLDKQFWIDCIGEENIKILCGEERLSNKLQNELNKLPKHADYIDLIVRNFLHYYHASSKLYSDSNFKDYIENQVINAIYRFQCGKYLWSIDQQKSITYLVKANYFITLCEGFISAFDYIRKGHERRKKQVAGAKKGGEKKAEQYQPVHNEIIRLLSKRVQEKGKWKSKKAALDEIGEAVWSYISKENNKSKSKKKKINLDEDAFPETLLNWSKNCDSVKDALNNSVYSAKKKQTKENLTS
ncbi:Uncharacterised protein [Providencia rettgeri]|nr:Uncharacterised protein [Providencia rettgeri]